MKKTKNILMAEMLASIALAVALVVLYETDTLLPGAFAGMGNEGFIVLALMELATICLIPLALRLFKFKAVGGKLVASGAKSLLVWGSLRMAMLCLPLVANTLLYYLFMDVAFGYMALICLVCLTFIYPSAARCANEVGGDE